MGRDRFKSKIICPKCNKEGVLSEWQEDGYSWMRNQDTYISSVPEGFIAIADHYASGKPTPVKCIDCDIFVNG